MYFAHSFILNSMILTQALIVKVFQVLNIHENACFYTFLVQKKQVSLSANLPFSLYFCTSTNPYASKFRIYCTSRS